jgi:AraC-like DNA-binding protein
VGKRLSNARSFPTEARKADYKAEKLARRMGKCPRQFRRNIQQFFKVSAKEYLGAYQINVAVNRLLAGDSLKNAYLKAGYKTRQHFTRVFKEYLGMTPGHFKKRIQKKVRFR